ncbi:hypothetical protein NQ314_013227 [Rhamnusium bicolor]|uniref:Fibronectin type-III domain-containing protein n=1 Tax=Rhamnusium bicolor TaxID=1586634 RepID=A0AAV8X701_9CUCU|nr:hypothetical protein NQ314_013227 [Rhamnusium bicolor]
MFRILSVLVFVVFHGASAQLCIPNPVANLTLDVNYTLYWQPSTNCPETLYLIYIHIEDDLQFIYNTEQPYLDVDFLPACERFYFEVRAFSNSELSDGVRLGAYIPAPSDADLRISWADVSTQEGSTFLRWQVTEKYAHCARSFRVVIYDSDNLPRDVYTERNFLFINNLVPCGQYQFSVRAIYNLATEGPIHFISYSIPGANSSLPVLERVNTTATSVSLSWTLPSYSENRCRITSVVIDALPFLHDIFPVVDSPERPLFVTTLSPLEPDSFYVLRVTVVNTEGTSDTFPIGVQTLPN